MLTSFAGLESTERGDVSGWSMEGFLLPADGSRPKNLFLPPPPLADFPRGRLKEAGGDLTQGTITERKEKEIKIKITTKIKMGRAADARR